MSPDSVPPSFDPLVNLRIDYARELNPQQHAAVTAVPGPALVIAGAGAGKTRTLIYRVAFLLEQGIPAERILLLTFTFFFSSRRRHTRSVSAFLLNRSSDLTFPDRFGLY